MHHSPEVIQSIRNAVEAMPDDVPLRLHLAQLLVTAGQRDEAVRHVGAILQRDPGNTAALALLAGLSAADGGQPAAGEGGVAVASAPDGGARGGPSPEDPGSRGGPSPKDPRSRGEPSPKDPGSRGEPSPKDPGSPPDGFDWSRAESEVSDLVLPRFVGGTTADASASDPAARAFEAESARLSLDDVAGMTEVKQRLEAAFLAPMRNPELRRLYGKSLRGGLLMYGPPGCGKTFIARAVAGELGARFMHVSFADVIDMFVGQSERNIREMFGVARRSAPCVLFLDEVDALGQKRSQLRHTPMRSAVNQLLLEMDDLFNSNDGVFVLAATNHPWDVDSALRRPGRFDRTLLVLPPDEAARAGVFRYHLRDRPVAGADPARLAKLTDGYSAADLAHVCETAAERALLDSVRRGEPRMIGQADLESAIGDVRPSLGPWLETARNVALYANEGGTYDDLAAYLRTRRII